MAWTVSGIFGQTLIDMFENTTAHDLTTLDAYQIALYNNTTTPAFDAAAAVVAYDTGVWATANEATGTNWAAGGVTIGQPTLTIADPAATQLSWDSPDVVVATTTIATAFYGGLIYNQAITTPVDNQGLCAIYFGGTGYTTTAGTLTITVDTNGWFYVDYA